MTHPDLWPWPEEPEVREQCIALCLYHNTDHCYVWVAYHAGSWGVCLDRANAKLPMGGYGHFGYDRDVPDYEHSADDALDECRASALSEYENRHDI